jgi:hypothetical protein
VPSYNIFFPRPTPLKLHFFGTVEEIFMATRFFLIPVGSDGSLIDDLRIYSSKASALETAFQHSGRYPGLIIAEEIHPDKDLELIRVVGRVSADVIRGLVS